MADSTKEIARQIERLVSETQTTNKTLKRIERIADIRRFDDLEPPPLGVVIQNMKGCVCINLEDYRKMTETENK